jgi:hypothetical protein
MSTTFDVYPTMAIEVTAGAVIDSVTEAFHKRIRLQGMSFEPELTLSRRDSDHTYFHDLTGSDPFICSENEYIWLSINQVSGGTDIYFRNDVHDDPELRDDLIKELEARGNLAAEDRRILSDFDHWFQFRRSMGQPGSINILYGIAAGCLADLTNGLADSMDGAWDHLKMPMKGFNLVNEHMNVAYTDDQRLIEWSVACWEGLALDISNIESKA